MRCSPGSRKTCSGPEPSSGSRRCSPWALFFILTSFALARPSSAQIATPTEMPALPSSLSMISLPQLMQLLSDRLIWQTQRSRILTQLSDEQTIKISSLVTSLASSSATQAGLQSDLDSSRKDSEDLRQALLTTSDSLRRSRSAAGDLKTAIEVEQKAADKIQKDLQTELTAEKIKGKVLLIGGIVVAVPLVVDVIVELVVGKSLLELIRGK